MIAPNSSKDEALLAFGKAMAAWAKVERGLYLWFEHITLLDYQKCNPLYYSVQTFRARLELIRAALSCNQLENDEREFIEIAMKVVLPYNSVRNKLAHGEFTLDGLVFDSKVVDHRERQQTVIDQQSLDRFTQEAGKLARLLADARDLALGFEDHNDPEASLQRCIREIREMSEAQKEVDREKSRSVSSKSARARRTS